MKLIWDKHWHKGNQAKRAKSVEERKADANCPICDETDSQQHWIRECQVEPLPGIRRDYIALVKGYIKRHREDRHPKTAAWMEVALDIAVTHPQGADIWVGMWPPHLKQLLKT